MNRSIGGLIIWVRFGGKLGKIDDWVINTTSRFISIGYNFGLIFLIDAGVAHMTCLAFKQFSFRLPMLII